VRVFVKEYRDVLGFFVEQNSDNCANLQRVSDEKGGEAKRVVRCGSLDDHLHEVLKVAKVHRCSLSWTLSVLRWT
jgi:hypothetical protein